MRETFNQVNAASEAAQALKRCKIAFERRTDGSLFVPGDVDFSGQDMTELPDLSQVDVGGFFHCDKNRLTSLKGAPRSVGRDFSCTDNQLQSLEYGPRKVGGSLVCRANRLTSLKGAPEIIGGIVDCTQNQLRSLKGLPRRVEFLYCRDNDLASLDYAPAFSVLGSDFGTFARREDIPKELRLSAATRSRRARTKEARLDFRVTRATVVSRPFAVGKPLRFSGK